MSRVKGGRRGFPKLDRNSETKFWGRCNIIKIVFKIRTAILGRNCNANTGRVQWVGWSGEGTLVGYSG
jgi:hypothetical protein